MPKTSEYAQALEDFFSELNEEWLAVAPERQVITDERVLRELSLPADADTRLVYFSVPSVLLSRYRELVFPIADGAGLVPASGDEIAAWQGNVRVILESLLQRAYAVIGDVSTDSTRVWSDLRVAALRSKPPRIAILAEEGQEIPANVVPGAHIFVRPQFQWAQGDERDETAAIESWLDEFADWLEMVGARISIRLEDEATRLLGQHMYRAAVIAISSALEVALRERLQETAEVTGVQPYSRSKRVTSPTRQLFEQAVARELISHDELSELWELQRTRNSLVHTPEGIHGQTARSLVRRASRVISRLRNEQSAV